jgi:hypothetical protein
MNLLNAILMATGCALGAAILATLLIEFRARRDWDKASRICAGQLKERRDRLAKIADELKLADAIGHEHLCWTLDCVSSSLVDLETARTRSDLNTVISAFVRFRDGLSYFDGYLAGHDFLVSRRDAALNKLWAEAHRELVEAADRMSKLGWTLDGSTVVRSAMEEMASSLRGMRDAELHAGLTAAAASLARANRVLFAAMVESDTSK